PYRSSLYALGIALLLSILTLQEGVVCVLFALPLLLPFVFSGTFVGASLRRFVRSRRARRASLGSLLLLGLGGQVVESYTSDPARHPRHVAVSERVIDASPEELFDLLTSEPVEVSRRWPWFVR